MKKLIIFVLALSCAFTLVSCIPKGDPKYANTVSYAGWTDDPAIASGALNGESLQNAEETHLPIFKIDTLEDLEQFKTKYSNILSMDQGYNSILSFNDALAKAQFDREDFFEKNTLLVVYVTAISGSYRFGVGGINATDDSVCVYVEKTNAPKVLTDDMAGWFILGAVENDQIKNCSSFDAILIKK